MLCFAQPQSTSTLFLKTTQQCALFTLQWYLKQPASLSREAYLYAGTDLQSLSVSQKVTSSLLCEEDFIDLSQTT